MHNMSVIGLPDAAVKESEDRVRPRELADLVQVEDVPRLFSPARNTAPDPGSLARLADRSTNSTRDEVFATHGR